MNAEKKDRPVGEDSSPQHGASYDGLCYMAHSRLDVGFGHLLSLLTECLLKGILDIRCTDTVGGDEWLVH